MRIIAVTNQKGGVGKTTTVANLGAALASKGLRVCLIDLDPQAHLTMHFGIDAAVVPTSMYDVLTDDTAFSRAAVMVENNLTIAPAVIDLAAVEVELAAAVGREQILTDKLAAESLPYELVMIDCAPSLGLLTLNALAAAAEVLIPLQPHFLALQGLGKLLETVSLVRRRINPSLTVAGVVFCMYESATRLAGEITDDVRQFLADARGRDLPWSDARVFETFIRRNIKLAECPGHGTTIFHYDPASHGAVDYLRLAEEFLTPPPAEPPPATEDVPAEQAEEVATGEKIEHAPEEPAPPAHEAPAEGTCAPADETPVADTPPDPNPV
ncbi:MAG TPA: ParA family protein [Phycisphaerae bacterium]|nr:ParA family protein [Phycisphaerae bacterium]